MKYKCVVLELAWSVGWYLKAGAEPKKTQKLEKCGSEKKIIPV